MENTFQKQINYQIEKISVELERINKFKEKQIEGYLKIKNDKGHVYYQWKTKDEDRNDIRKYLSKKELSTIKDLAQKGYYDKIEPILIKNLNVLHRLNNSYQYNAITEAYEKLIVQRQNLIDPIEKSKKQFVEEWQTETYKPCNKYPEALRYETNAGEFVRSKSEVIIANLLHMEADRLLYKYERPLKLRHQGREITLYPDFTVLNTQTGKITYWEHAGLMSNPEYVSDFVWKNNLYYENHLLPGTDVLFTFETEDHPLEIRMLKNMISHLLM